MKEEREIKDIVDFEDYGTNMLDEFAETLIGDPRYTRDVEEGDGDQDEFTYMYTDKGWAMMKRFEKRIIKVGERMFPGESIDMWPMSMKEI